MGALNEIPVEETQDLILQEAQKILRGETMMPPTRKHLEALAGLSGELVEALKAMQKAFAEVLPGIGYISCRDYAICQRSSNSCSKGHPESKGWPMICPCCESPATKIYSCAEPGCNFRGCWTCLRIHYGMFHSTDSSATFSRAGSGEDGLLCDSSPLSQTSGSSSQRTERRTSNAEVSGSTPDSPTSSNCISDHGYASTCHRHGNPNVKSFLPLSSTVEHMSYKHEDEGSNPSAATKVFCGTVDGHGSSPRAESGSVPTFKNHASSGYQTPPAGIHFAGEQAARDNSVNDAPTAHLSPAIHPRKAWKCSGCGTIYLCLRQCEYDPCAVMQEVTVTVSIDRAWPLPEITELKSPAIQRAQSTGNILDVERLEEIEAEREGSDLGGYPNPADNPRFA